MPALSLSGSNDDSIENIEVSRECSVLVIKGSFSASSISGDDRWAVVPPTNSVRGHARHPSLSLKPHGRPSSPW